MQGEQGECQFVFFDTANQGISTCLRLQDSWVTVKSPNLSGMQGCQRAGRVEPNL